MATEQMTERLLQYIWQFQYFSNTELCTTAGTPVRVIQPGRWNHHQGPDFLDARVRIGDQLWVGNIELHLQASDWHRHAHHRDDRYLNVILHVVWHSDDECLAKRMPTLVLDGRIPGMLLQQYHAWMHSTTFIPCAGSISTVDALVWTNWRERLMMERLQRKCASVHSMLQRNRQHWEETLWWMLARNFGLQVNAEAFEQVAQSIPFPLLSRHRGQIHQLEALLLGQAGLLKDDYPDDYFTMLKKEYRFYQRKYRLQPIPSPMYFLRMRPPSFPTVRLAQLAMLLHSSGNMFANLLEAESAGQVKALLHTTANDYWHYHYTFGHATGYHPKVLGKQMIDGLVVNTVAPIVFAYGQLHEQPLFMNRALQWLADLPAEKNAITRGFESLQVSCSTAAQSQALIELKTLYCERRRCLDCAVATAILKTARPAPAS